MNVGDLITFGNSFAPGRTGLIIDKWETQHLIELENDAKWVDSWSIEVLWDNGVEVYEENDFELFEVMDDN